MLRAGCSALWVRRHRGARGTPASLLHAGGCPWGEELPVVCFPLTAVGRSRAFRHTSPAWKPEFLIFHRPAHSAATAASSASET